MYNYELIIFYITYLSLVITFVDEILHCYKSRENFTALCVIFLYNYFQIAELYYSQVQIINQGSTNTNAEDFY